MDKKITIQPTKYSKFWPWKMAWRDSRKSRGKLLLFITSISLGIAAMVGITSFRENLLAEIDKQAKGLVGSDIRVQGGRDLPDSLLRSFKSMTADFSQENYFASMVMFSKTGGTRLVQVRALEGNYPYYGTIATKPAEASRRFQSGRYALVDEKMMIQYDAQIGDSLSVGLLSFEIIGAITQIPGQTDVSSSVSPVVYIPYQYLEETGLIKKGSRINYLHYFMFPEQPDTAKVWGKLAGFTESKGFDVETVEEEKRETGEDFENLSNFLEASRFYSTLARMSRSSELDLRVCQKQSTGSCCTPMSGYESQTGGECVSDSGSIIWIHWCIDWKHSGTGHTYVSTGSRARLSAH